MSTLPVRFADLKIGDKFRLESMWCEKIIPWVSEQSRKFYRGEEPGYPGKSDFYDWNVKTQFMGHGEYSYTSLAPDTLVIPI